MEWVYVELPQFLWRAYVFSVNCMRILASSEVNVLRSGVTDKIRQMTVCGNYYIPVNAIMDEVEEGG